MSSARRERALVDSDLVDRALEAVEPELQHVRRLHHVAGDSVGEPFRVAVQEHLHVHAVVDAGDEVPSAGGEDRRATGAASGVRRVDLELDRVRVLDREVVGEVAGRCSALAHDLLSGVHHSELDPCGDGDGGHAAQIGRGRDLHAARGRERQSGAANAVDPHRAAAQRTVVAVPRRVMRLRA